MHDSASGHLHKDTTATTLPWKREYKCWLSDSRLRTVAKSQESIEVFHPRFPVGLGFPSVKYHPEEFPKEHIVGEWLHSFSGWHHTDLEAAQTRYLLMREALL